MSKIGIMGGTFNPIHIGHLMLAEAAWEELALDEIWFIPAGCPYMKKKQLQTRKGMPLPEERLEMTRLAVQDTTYFRCLDLEIRRDGNTYSFETLEELRRLHPEHRFFFLCGADCLYSIENWREPGRIFAACDIVAAVRGDASLEEMGQKAAQLHTDYGARITLMPFRNLEISSSELRDRVKNGKSIRYMAPEKVITYIEEKGFYSE